jgi:acetyl-CoA C-acetyltransferase
VRAGLPVTVSGTTVNRFCSSGLQAIAMAASACIVAEGVPVMIAGGVESHLADPRAARPTAATSTWLDPWIVMKHKPELYLSMIETADNVAARYGIGREAQDRYSLQSQRKHRGGPAGRPLRRRDRADGRRRWRSTRNRSAVTQRTVTLDRDEGNRADTTLRRAWPSWKPVDRRRQVRHRRQRQPALGRRVGLRVVMATRSRRARGLQPLGIFRGLAVAGCEPDEMGIGPVFAVPKLLERHGLKVDDIGLWELNEAFAVQVLYCRDKLGIPTSGSTSTAARSRSAIPSA